VPLIGVSIAVPDPCGSELQGYRVSLGDDDARRIPTHITLLPPTDLADHSLDEVVTHLVAAARSCDRFPIHLRGTGTFRPTSPVVFVGVVEGISECELLAKSVCSGPLEVDLEFPYHPHVTIAHHQPESKLEQAFVEFERFDAEFDVNEMWLYLHDAASGWQPTRAFALGAR
jgi:2'-5' RNA ligase